MLSKHNLITMLHCCDGVYVHMDSMV